MVIGLLNGLASMFSTEINVKQTISREDRADHDAFLITISGE